MWPTHLNQCVVERHHFLALIYSAAISASAAEAITDLIIFAIVNTGPLVFGFGLFYDRKIWALAPLRAFYLLRNPASACAANIMSLFRKMISSSGYVATYSRSCSIASDFSLVSAAC